MVHAFRHFEAALAPHLAVVAEERKAGSVGEREPPVAVAEAR